MSWRSESFYAGAPFAAAAALLLAFGSTLWFHGAEAAVFNVNSPGDVHDANPGDGVCETAMNNHACTLRAAVDEANALTGADTINLQSGATYLLNLTDTVDSYHAGLVVTDSVTIAGAGSGSTIDGNGATTGAGVFALTYCIGDVVDPQDSSCTRGNVAVVMTNLRIQHGQASQGGGISSNAALSLDHCVVTANTAIGSNALGGGIASYPLDQPLTITNSVISANTTGSNNALGAGIYDQSPTTIVDTTISGNSTPGDGGGLAYIVAGGDPIHIVGSTISGNQAFRGGGIFAGSLIAINSTISGNFSSSDGAGFYHVGGTAGLYNATVAFNQANSDSSGSAVGGGIASQSGTFDIADSIIADNELIVAGPVPLLDFDECAGTITSLGNNILTNVKAIHCTINGSYAATEPLLAALAFNGGPTRTHALQPGSPAIDAGNNAGCVDDLGEPIVTDQRGIARPYGQYCDIGAFEYGDEIFTNGFDP